MITRPLFLTMMLGAAVAFPYVMSTGFGGRPKGRETETVTASLGNASRPAAFGGPAVAPIADPRGQAGATPASTADSVGSPAPGMNLEQVINFNVTPAWIMSQWPRVSASLSELDFQGYRVALVSGVRPDDLAGSLTYYFDSSQHATRICFQGTTGDPRRLVRLVTAQFGMGQIASDDPGVVAYAVKWNNRPRSELRIRTASIVRASQSRASYEVELTLRRF
jgi:hypothetical protein